MYGSEPVESCRVSSLKIDQKHGGPIIEREGSFKKNEIGLIGFPSWVLIMFTFHWAVSKNKSGLLEQHRG